MNKKLLLTIAVAIFGISGIAFVKAGIGSSGGVKEPTVVPPGRESNGVVPPGRESHG